MKILLIDNDVMVYLFVYLYDADKKQFKSVMNFLQLEYRQIWIPKVVKSEFLCKKRRNRKRSRRLEKVKKEYHFIDDCPIKVGKKDIILINGTKEQDAGEADAVWQGHRAKSGAFVNYPFSDIEFLSNDSGAIELAEQYGVVPYTYKQLREKFLEAGITLPS